MAGAQKTRKETSLLGCLSFFNNKWMYKSLKQLIDVQHETRLRTRLNNTEKRLGAIKSDSSQSVGQQGKILFMSMEDNTKARQLEIGRDNNQYQQ